MADDQRDRVVEKLTRACSHFVDDPDCAEMTANGVMAVLADQGHSDDCVHPDQHAAVIREWEDAKAEVENLTSLNVAYAGKLAEAGQRADRAEKERENLAFEKREVARHLELVRMTHASVVAERDLLQETLAESDLGALTLAQWEAIAAADADRDRLEDEVGRLRAYIAKMEAEPEGGEDEPPTDPAELRELWAFICGDARWKHRLLVKRGIEVERLRSQSAEANEAIRLAHRIMACSSRDWSLHADDAWLYALIVGWDCEIPEHTAAGHDPIDCSGPNHLEDFAERFGWTEGGIAKLRAQRQAIAGLDTKTGAPGEKPDWRERARARVGERVDARMKELMAVTMSPAEFDEAMRRNRAEAEAFLDQQSRGPTVPDHTTGGAPDG